jgi:tRNA 2-thiouridine synthesizing protein C
MNSVLVLINKAPYGRENALGALYVVIACLDKEFSADILLLDDGVYAALDNQNSESTINHPNIAELMYSIFPQGKIFVHIDSLIQRDLDYPDLIDIVEIVDDNSLYGIVKSKSKVITI